MLFPFIISRIVKPYSIQGYRINTVQPIVLKPITAQAGKSQVLQFISSASANGLYMLNGKRSDRITHMATAILTVSFCSFFDNSPGFTG
jgi:hypothetical protein